MHRLFALWRKEILALSRDWHGLLVLFAMPTVFILIMSLALKNAFGPGQAPRFDYLALDRDGTGESAALLAGLAEAENYRRLDFAGDEPALRTRLARGEASFGLVLAPGLGRAVADSEAEPRGLVEILAEPGANAQALALLRAEVQARLGRLRLKALLTEAGQEDLEPARLDALMARAAVSTRYLPGAGGAAPTSVQQSVPAWLVFSMFFVVIPISTLFLTERTQGTLARLKTMGLPAWQLFLGKFGPFFLINQVQAVLMGLVGVYLVPRLGGDALRLGESWAALGLMTLAVSCAAIAYALLIAVLVKTTEQATTLGGLSNILFGALGGIMVPKFVMPEFMQELTALSPMAWGLDGYLKVFLRGGDAFSVLPQAGALLGFALAAGALAVLVYRFKGVEA
ncbi:MAG: ABC transporter permease [Gammaproteobacteria bacterium]|nr:ABC transporter permease [Gammaproteobacteria bacterium]